VVRLQVSVCDVRGVPQRKPALAAWLARVSPARARGSVTIAFVSDAGMRTLNRTWRHVDRATDVLSFPAEERLSQAGSRLPASGSRKTALAEIAGSAARRGAKRVGQHLSSESREPKAGSRLAGASTPEPGAHLGDIVIATGVAARQARAAGHAVETEWRVLALHGLLHLLGYDHEGDDGEMARVEARLRRRGGLAAGLIERAPGAADGRALRGPSRTRNVAPTRTEGAPLSRATSRQKSATERRERRA
jgi:probable rRNA maturation factor